MATKDKKYRLTKPERKKFEAGMVEVMRKHGGVREDSDLWSHAFVLETPAGRMTVHFDEDKEPSEVLSVFCKFADPKRAEAVLSPGRLTGGHKDHRLNPFSGKWNFHYVPETDRCVDAIVDYIGTQFNVLMTAKAP